MHLDSSTKPPARVKWFRPKMIVGAAVLTLAALVCRELFRGAQHKAWTSRSRNYLKQIGLALHNYHDTFGMFPPGQIRNAEHGLAHGWMFSILPYIDQSPIYSWVDQNHPWDDPYNLPVFRLEHPVFLNPSIAETVSDDGLGLSHYAGNSLVLLIDSGLRLREIVDGKSHTIMAGEIAEAFQPWGSPMNLRDAAKGINAGPGSYGRPERDGAHFLMADGAVRFVPYDVSPAVMAALASPAGREQVEFPHADPKRAAFAPRSESYNPPGRTPAAQRKALAALEKFVPSAHRDKQGNIVSVRLPVIPKDEPVRIVRDSDLRPFCDLPYLRELFVWSDEITDDGLEQLNCLHELRALALNSRKMTAQGMLKLNNLQNLKVLAVPRLHLSPEQKRDINRLLPNCEIREYDDDRGLPLKPIPSPESANHD